MMAHALSRRLINLTSLFIALLISHAAAAQTIWHVDDNAPNDPEPGAPEISDPLEDGSLDHPFDAIQEALDAAVSGDTVLVADGVYVGIGNRELNPEGKGILITSEHGPLVCILDCEQQGRGFFFNMHETADTIVSGFTIMNGLVENRGGAICCLNESSPVIRACRLIRNRAGRGGAFFARYGNPALYSCVIAENTADEYGGGIYSREGTILIENCTIVANNAILAGGGVQLEGGDDAVIHNTILADNTAPTGPAVGLTDATNPSSLTISYCNVVGGQTQIALDAGCTLQWGAGNIDQPPALTVGGYYLCHNSPCLEAGDPSGAYAGLIDINAEERLFGVFADIGADEFQDTDGDGLPDWWEIYYFGNLTTANATSDMDGDGTLDLDAYRQGMNPYANSTICYVDPLGDDSYDGRAPFWDGVSGPKRSISAGMAVADGEELKTVLLQDGMYRGPNNRNLDFQGKAITVCSRNGYENCVIDCENAGIGFHFRNGETDTSVLRGLTITNATEDDPNEYGAVLCESSSPTIEYCDIHADGSSCNSPVGISMTSRCKPRIINSHIYGYSIGIKGTGCLSGYITCCHVEQCIVGIRISTHYENTDYLVICGCRINDCGAYSFTAHGLDISGLILVDKCIINANRSACGGGIEATGPFVINDSDIYGNMAQRFSNRSGLGGALYITATDVCRIVNCDIYDNQAHSAAGIYVIYMQSIHDLIIDNCRIWNNMSASTGGGICARIPSITSTDKMEPLALHVSNTSFVNNQASIGGAVYVFFNEIMHLYPCDISLINTQFIGNTALTDAGAVAIDPSQQCTIAGCLFQNNTADAGHAGALLCNNDASNVTNCIFTGNRAAQRGGGMYVLDGDSIVKNNIFWNNDASLGKQFAVKDAERVDFAYNLYEPGTSSTYAQTGVFVIDETNLAADPRFVDPDGPDNDPATWEDNDFHLLPGSPCIDAGYNPAVPPDALDLDDDGDVSELLPFDLDGNPRFLDDVGMIDRGEAGTTGLPVVDIGAYEFQGETCVGDLNGDYQINLQDLAQLLGHYGTTTGAGLFRRRSQRRRRRRSERSGGIAQPLWAAVPLTLRQSAQPNKSIRTASTAGIRKVDFQFRAPGENADN